MKRKGLQYLTKRERDALKDYLARLKSEFGDEIQHVILFGSKVRGDFDAESDIDVCIVTRHKDARQRRALTALGIKVDLEHNVLLGDFIVEQERFDLMAEYYEPLYKDLITEGVELWTNPIFTRAGSLSWSGVDNVH